MIELVINQNNTRYAVIINGKLVVSTKSLEYARTVLDHAKNNDTSFADRNFKPIKFNLQDPKTI